jgi:hypothetical protein
MQTFGRLGLLRFVLRARDARLGDLAAAGAMLTCVAVVLNLGPFAKAPKLDGLHEPIIQQTALSEQPALMSSNIDVRTRSESIDARMELFSLSAVEAPAASQAFTSKDADGETISQPPQQELAAADPAAQPHEDHANPDLAKRATIVGVWAPDAGTCSARNFREGLLPAVINTDGAWAGETFCVFKNKIQTETGWRMVAQCSNPRERWTANVRLMLDGNRLTWTSKRGTQAYTRCATDVLMAEAR